MALDMAESIAHDDDYDDDDDVHDIGTLLSP